MDKQTLTDEQLRQRWDSGKATPEEEVEAMVRLFGMPRDRAEAVVYEHWKDEVPGAFTDGNE